MGYLSWEELNRKIWMKGCLKWKYERCWEWMKETSRAAFSL